MVNLLVNLPFYSIYTSFWEWDQKYSVWFILVRLKEVPGITLYQLRWGGGVKMLSILQKKVCIVKK